MDNHIDFSCIECENLQYIDKAQCFVCIGECIDLKDTDLCMRCKFDAQLRRERRLKGNG